MLKGKGKQTCVLCGEEKYSGDLVSVKEVEDHFPDVVLSKHPELAGDGFICFACLSTIVTKHVKEIMEMEKGELSMLENEVAESLLRQELLAKNVNAEFEQRLTFGDRVADKVASFGGSWGFIGLFAVVMLLWILINTGLLLSRPFDPYPFILLNLILSCLAAIQAPVIMMSQNRRETKDRLRSENDYRVNLKAELELRHLNLKMDQLISHQWQRLLEIQEMQIAILDELLAKVSATGR